MRLSLVGHGSGGVAVIEDGSGVAREARLLTLLVISPPGAVLCH